MLINRKIYRKSFTTDFTEPSLTDQSFKEESDLNFIIQNYLKNNIPVNQSSMQFGDSTTVKEYQDAMYIVAEAKSNFEQLPSSERDKFKCVENYLEFISNPDNIKESYERGLIDPNSIDLNDIYPIQSDVKENVNISLNTDDVNTNLNNNDISNISNKEG